MTVAGTVVVWYPGAKTDSEKVPAVRAGAPRDHVHIAPAALVAQDMVFVTGPVSVACTSLMTFWGEVITSMARGLGVATKPGQSFATHATSPNGHKAKAKISNVRIARV